ncbi:60S acidic ribosomal protein P1 [Xylogone sp. PMI_703]|nr:60S acidic ribosomal protein P1 [Xylogone sp. PMI_703]
MSNAELASSYAALILADDGVDITAEKLQTLIKAAGVTDVEPIWTSLFAKALEGKDVKDLLLNVGSGGGAAAAPAAGGAAAGGEAAAAEEKAEEKEEGMSDPIIREISEREFTNKFIAKEESDEDMGFGLFD